MEKIKNYYEFFLKKHKKGHKVKIENSKTQK